MVATLPGRTQGLGLITEPLLAALELDRVAFAGINFWATLAGALFSIPCGRLVDRFGSRTVQTVASLLLGLTVIGMSRVSGVVELAAVITLTRGFGQTALSVVSLTRVGKQFPENRNKAMAIYSLLTGIGFIAAFPLAGNAVLIAGWRAAWLWTGVVIAAVVAPLSWFARAAETTEADQTATDGIAFSHALRTPAFWIFALASAMFGLVYSGIALFNESILQQRGFGPEVYHSTLAVSTMLGLAANFGAGWLASKYRIQSLTAAAMAVLAAAVAALPFVASYAHVMLYATAMGVAGGIVTVVFFTVWGQVFGRKNLGRIQGAAQMMTVFASALGPWALAKSLERTGSYQPIFLLLAGFIAILGIASWRVNTRLS